MKKITLKLFLCLLILLAVSLLFSKKEETKFIKANMLNLDTEQLKSAIAAQLGFVPKSEYDTLLEKYKSLEAKYTTIADFIPSNAEVGKCYARCIHNDYLENSVNQDFAKKGYTYKGKEVPYKNITKRIKVQESRTRWIAKHDMTQKCMSADTSTCQTWQLKHIPAKYDTITIKVIDTSKLTYPIEEVVRDKRYDEYQIVNFKHRYGGHGFTDWVEVICCESD